MRRAFQPITALIAALALLGTVLFAEAVIAAEAKPPTVVLLGDSLTAGLGLPPNEALPAQLRTKLEGLGLRADIVDQGVSGDTTGGGLARLDWALSFKPDILMIELGANDGFRAIDGVVVRANLEQIIQRTQATGAKVLLAGMQAPMNWTDKYKQDFDAVYPELAQTYGVAFYPFFLEGVALDPTLNQPDGYHPNAKGVAAIVDHIAPLLAQMLSQLPGARS